MKPRVTWHTACGVVGAALALACATPYQRMGATGGYEDSKVQADTYNVTFSGNGFTSPTKAKNYLLYRCAEIAVQNGYDFYVIVSGDSIVNYSVMGSGAGAGTVAKPTYSSTIKLGRGTPPPNNPNAYDAHQVMTNLGPLIER